MPFGNIAGTVTGQTFVPRTQGRYVLSSLTFADPSNEFRINGASNRRDGSRAGSVSRIIQKDVTVNNNTQRKGAILTLNVTIPADNTFTPIELDNAIADISSFLTPETLSRVLQGES